MAKFAPVVPWAVATQLQKRGILGEYHLLLAHDVIKPENIDAYRRIYKENFGGLDRLIIMDNSVIELGHPVPMEHMMLAVRSVQAQVIVLPDVLLDKVSTIKATRKGYDEYFEILDQNKSFMVVPQGGTFEEWKECADIVCKLSAVEWVGIARNVQESLGQSRVDACMYIIKKFPRKKVHLLGFSNNLLDDLAACKLPSVVGIDSAVPIRIAMRERLLIGKNDIPHTPRGDWWDYPNGKLTHPSSPSSNFKNMDIVEENLRRIRMWCSNEHSTW